MPHTYGHTGSSTGTSGSSSTRQSTTNAQGQVAPPGFHYMPDGTLMSDVEHARLFGSNKVLTGLQLDYSDLPAATSKRNFTILGTSNAEFNLEIKNEDSYYYNFKTNLFQAGKASLEKTINTSGYYQGSITFPTVTDDDQYDIFLFAKPGTTHSVYNEVRFRDDTIDINSSTGSNSLLMQKIIYQYTDVTLTISPFSPNSVTDLIKASSRVDDTVTCSRGRVSAKSAFTISCEVNAATKSYRIIKQPEPSDFLSFVTPTVGAAPELLPGENEYPTARFAFTGDDVNGAVTSGSVVRMDNTDLSAAIEVGDKITSPVTTDRVDGAVTSGIKVVIDNNVAGKMAVGDRITSSSTSITNDARFERAVVTVAALDPDGDNAKEFSMSEALEIADGAILTFSSKVNRSLTTVTVVETSGTATDFTMSQAIQFRDNQPLTFTPRMNYQWPLDNIENITEGMIVVPVTNVTADTKIGRYEDTVTLYEGKESEEKIIKNKAPFASTKNQKPTVVKGLVTAQPGNIVFDKQQKLALAGGGLKIGGYGTDKINDIYGYDVVFSDLEVALTPITTTTTEACINSTSVTVAERSGILDSVSTVSGIGINPSAAVPTVSSGAGAVSGQGAIVLSAAQNIESGATLTFANAGLVATITGNIEVLKAGTASETIRLDVEKILSIT